LSRITTHVLDVSRGRPGAGIEVRLERHDGEGWKRLASARTDEDGRVAGFADDDHPPGTYRLIFATGDWFASQQRESFHPEVEIVFRTTGGEAHDHVPLLLAPFGYSTYRGS